MPSRYTGIHAGGNISRWRRCSAHDDWDPPHHCWAVLLHGCMGSIGHSSWETIFVYILNMNANLESLQKFMIVTYDLHTPTCIIHPCEDALGMSTDEGSRPTQWGKFNSHPTINADGKSLPERLDEREDCHNAVKQSDEGSTKWVLCIKCQIPWHAHTVRKHVERPPLFD